MNTYYSDGYILVIDKLDNTRLEEPFQFIVTAKNIQQGMDKVNELALEKYKEELELDITECEKVVIENFYRTTEDVRL